MDKFLRNTIDLQPASPLWQRVPTRDAQGKLAGDFMMIITGLNKQNNLIQKRIISELQRVLGLFSNDILFVDLNLKNNILWVSYSGKPQIRLEIAGRLHNAIPEARLIAQQLA
jgi:hypothetical protein